MTLTLNTVTGNIFIPAGVAQPDATVDFTLSHVDFEFDTIVPYVVTATIAPDGSFSATLWSNAAGSKGSWYDVSYQYLVPVSGQVVRKALGRIQVPATGIADLDTLLQMPINDPATQYAYFSQAEWDALVDQVARAIRFPAPYPGVPEVTGANRLIGTDNSGLLTEYAVTDIAGIPVVQPTPYETRADFMAALLPTVPPLHVNVAGLSYVQDPTGTALQHPGGVNYSPQRFQITALHWGITAATSTGDMSAVLQDMIDYACSLIPAHTGNVFGAGPVVVDLCGLEYGLGAGLTMNRGIVFQNGMFRALPGFTDPLMIHVVAGAENAVLQHLYLDGGLSGTTRYADLIQINAHRVRVDDVHGTHFPNFGLYVQDSQECVVTRCNFREWIYGEAGALDSTLRTATAYWVPDADGIYANCVAAYSRYPLHVTGALNLFKNFHVYNGASVVMNEDVAVYIKDAPNNAFTGCYFDNGNVVIEATNSNTGRLATSLKGCLFQHTGNGNNTYGIRVISSNANETVPGLSVVGCEFNGNYSSGVIAFEGTGTYVPDDEKGMVWIGNARSGGGAAGFEMKTGFGITAIANEMTLRTSANDYDLNINGSYNVNVDSNNSGTFAKRAVRLNYGDVFAHDLREDFIGLGKGSVTGGGYALAIAMYGDNPEIRPHDGAGGTSAADAWRWNAAKQAFEFKGAGAGIICKSPNGTSYRLVPQDDGGFAVWTTP